MSIEVHRFILWLTRPSSVDYAIKNVSKPGPVPPTTCWIGAARLTSVVPTGYKLDRERMVQRAKSRLM